MPTARPPHLSPSFGTSSFEKRSVNRVLCRLVTAVRLRMRRVSVRVCSAVMCGPIFAKKHVGDGGSCSVCTE